ncbi:hypothetical protein DEO72_LG4g217 [Vigna unguiculata]|uniref:Uncharacterized protein n=1 Tax=Vigna unguiculata TaxID=3917 RepID=A0A4D6LL94_VIGUN|nr:hypothetical protein DEO72_LG4g217 [Vigna unguiculata]
MLWMCVVYKALGDTLRMDFFGAFLKLWLIITSLKLWLGMEGKHVAFLELWLGMASLELWLGMEDEHCTFLQLWLKMVCVIGVSVRVVARTKGLHSIEKSQVVASDVLILCREYELRFILGTPLGVAVQRCRTWINMVVAMICGIRG